MEITMNETIKKLRREAANNFIPIAEDMYKHGKSLIEIEITLEKYIEQKKRQFYQKKRKHSIRLNTREVIDKVYKLQNADSLAEAIFYDMLEKAKIPFEFQYKIGPYRVDYLINKTIVLECDGKHHQFQRGYDRNRDWYLEGLGYHVVRMSWDLICQIPDIVIDELKNLIDEGV